MYTYNRTVLYCNAMILCTKLYSKTAQAHLHYLYDLNFTMLLCYTIEYRLRL